MAINRISEFPKVTPSADDKILIEKNGEGGHMNLSEMPVSTPVEKKISDVQKDLNARITALAFEPGDTTGDAELKDIRKPATGFTVPANANAGDAVRAQVTQLDDKISNLKGDISNQMGQICDVTVGKQLFDRSKSVVGIRNIYNGEVNPNGDYKSSEIIPVVNGKTIYFSYYETPVKARTVIAYENGICVTAKCAESVLSYVVPEGITEIAFSWSIGNDEYFQAEYDEITPYSEYGTKVKLKAQNDIDKINGNIYKYGFYLDANGNEIKNENYGVSDFIAVEPNTTYTWYSKVKENLVGKLVEYDAKHNIQGYYSDYGDIGTTFTTYSKTTYIRFSFSLGAEIPLVVSGDNVVWKRILSHEAVQENVSDNSKAIKTLQEKNNTFRELSKEVNTAIDDYKLKLAKSIDTNCFTFSFITDVHLISSYNQETNHLKRLYVATKLAQLGIIKFIAFGGDLVSGENTVDEDMKLMVHGYETLKDNSKTDVFMCRGNHDGGHKSWKAKKDSGEHPTSDDIVTNKEWFNMMSKNLDVIYDSENPMGAYYYKDYENEKIRVIILNPYDFDGVDANGDVYNAMYTRSHITQKQASWLANEALNFSDKSNPSEWGIIVFSHDGVDADNDYFGNGDYIEELLQAFKTGTRFNKTYTRSDDALGHFTVTLDVDFTSQGSIDYIAFVHGHTHTDRIKYNNGVPHISTAASHPDTDEVLPEGATLPLPRTLGTISEYLYDTISVDRENRTINIYRFGAGNDRTATY